MYCVKVVEKRSVKKMDITMKERAVGALMGAFIGEALGVGPHWYYDIEALRKDYGSWIDDYTAPKEGRYHDGLKPGDLSQQGDLIRLVAELLVSKNGYSTDEFCQMMDEKYLKTLDGTPMGGPGGYTSQSMRHLWKRRIKEHANWDEVASVADTTEALERNIPLAIFYANDFRQLSQTIASNTALTQSDNLVGSLSVAYNAVLAMLIRGEPLDENIGIKLMAEVKKGTLPFHAVTGDGLKPPERGKMANPNEGLFASPDALLSPGYMALAAKDNDIKIEPAWKVSLVYGMPCAIYHMLPAVYYLSARYHNDFEKGILHAINGGGQNQVRAMLTGALIGAQVGINGIPSRLINGLTDNRALLKLANELSLQL